MPAEYTDDGLRYVVQDTELVEKGIGEGELHALATPGWVGRPRPPARARMRDTIKDAIDLERPITSIRWPREPSVPDPNSARSVP